MLECEDCRQKKILVTGVCADCAPQLHSLWSAAMKSIEGTDGNIVTSETNAFFEILEKRKLEGSGSAQPIGFLEPKNV